MGMFRRKRTTEATPQQLAATGASGGGGYDPIDRESGWSKLGGTSAREMPSTTLESARAHSHASYRAHPFGRAIVDTYVAFCVGDSGIGWEATDPGVRQVVHDFWHDPKVRLGDIQEVLFRTWMLNGELLWELMVGALGTVRFSPIDTMRVEKIELRDGNPLWPATAQVSNIDGQPILLDLLDVDDVDGLRKGRALWHAGWKASVFDRRGMPFMTTVVDHLGEFDTVLSNLIDRTALARYMVLDVEVKGGQDAVDGWIAARGGLEVPPSGSIEVHNDAVTIKPMHVPTGAQEDSTTLASVHTVIAAGTGLAKTWLSDPDGANRATSVSMAEPVRRRIGSVQREWLTVMTELLRFVVDRAVAAGRIPARVTVADGNGGTREVPASQTVTVTGPEIAASDAEVAAKVMLNLSTALGNLVEKGILTNAAAKVAAAKAWEQLVGRPFRADLADDPTPAPAQNPESRRLHAV